MHHIPQESTPILQAIAGIIITLFVVFMALREFTKTFKMPIDSEFDIKAEREEK